MKHERALLRTAGLLALLGILVGCSPMDPQRAVDRAPQPVGIDDANTFDELRQIVESLQQIRKGTEPEPDAVVQLLVVGEAAVTCDAIADPDMGAFRFATEGGEQLVTWVDAGMEMRWVRECWDGSPSFPGSAGVPVCTSGLANEVSMDCSVLLEGTKDVVRGLAEMDGYTFLWSRVTADPTNPRGDLAEYEIWYSDASGQPWYWKFQRSELLGERVKRGPSR